MAFPPPGMRPPRKREELKPSPKLKDYEKEEIKLSKISDLKKDDIVVARVIKPVTSKGAQMIIESLKGTFPKNKVLLVCDGANISLITAKSLNKLGWFRRFERKIITLSKAGHGLEPTTPRPKLRVRP